MEEEHWNCPQQAFPQVERLMKHFTCLFLNHWQRPNKILLLTAQEMLGLPEARGSSVPENPEDSVSSRSGGGG